MAKDRDGPPKRPFSFGLVGPGEFWHVFPAHPYPALPVQQQPALCIPRQHHAPWHVGIRCVLVAQGGDDVLGQPAVEGFEFGVAEAQQGLVDGGFAQHHGGFFCAGAVGEADGLDFVGVEAVVDAVGEAVGEQAGDVRGDEPGLVVDHDAAQEAFVAGEEGWGVGVAH